MPGVFNAINKIITGAEHCGPFNSIREKPDWSNPQDVACWKHDKKYGNIGPSAYFRYVVGADDDPKLPMQFYWNGKKYFSKMIGSTLIYMDSKGNKLTYQEIGQMKKSFGKMPYNSKRKSYRRRKAWERPMPSTKKFKVIRGQVTSSLANQCTWSAIPATTGSRVLSALNSLKVYDVTADAFKTLSGLDTSGQFYSNVFRHSQLTLKNGQGTPEELAATAAYPSAEVCVNVYLLMARQTDTTFGSDPTGNAISEMKDAWVNNGLASDTVGLDKTMPSAQPFISSQFYIKNYGKYYLMPGEVKILSHKFKPKMYDSYEYNKSPNSEFVSRWNAVWLIRQEGALAMNLVANADAAKPFITATRLIQYVRNSYTCRYRFQPPIRLNQYDFDTSMDTTPPQTLANTVTAAAVAVDDEAKERDTDELRSNRMSD